MRWLIVVAAVQGVYFLVTGMWPIVHMDSFEIVTGEKTDDWLVKTVALLICAVSIPLLVAAARLRVPFEVALLGIASAVALGAASAIFALSDTIRDVYLLDALAEAVLVAAWAFALWDARDEAELWGGWRRSVPQGASTGARARPGRP